MQVSAVVIELWAQPVDLSLKEASLESTLKEITKQSGYIFWYEEGLLKNSNKVTLRGRDMDVKQVLEQIFEKQPLTYEIVGNTVVLKKKEAVYVDPAAGRRVQENIRVSGEVTDTAGMKLPSVSVFVKGKSNLGTTTDLNGKYVLDVPENAILVFSMVGYETAEIAVSGRINIDVVLSPSASQLDDVVVVGFGRQKRTDMIGSVVSVKPEQLKVPSSNLTTALAGRVAGMIAFQRSGEPGMDNADFFIRGVTTFGYKVDPLILIDNVEVTTTDLARLQVDDIADFSIMKDATATAVYGARGANGVILITTKEGKEGPANISLRVENSVSTPTRNVELADPVTYMKMANEAILTRDPLGFLPFSQRKIERTAAGGNPLEYPATDWRQALLKDYTMNQRVNLSVNGGGKVARYFVSGALNQDNGVLKVDRRSNFNNNIDLKTYSLRSNVNINLSKTTELIVRLSGSFDDYTGPIDGGTKVYRDIMRTSPVLFAPYYPAEGEYSWVKHIMFGNFGTGGYLNPYADMVKGYREYSRSMTLAQLELKQNLSFLTEGLAFRALANTTRNAYFSVGRQYNPFYYEFRGESPLSPGTYTYYLINENQGTEYLDYNEGEKTVSSVFYMEAALSYNRTFNDKHALSGMLVNIMRNQLNGNAGDLQLSLPFRNLGVSGRFTYAYDSRYYAEFNFGFNGSERFYKTNRFGFFPSFGLAWSVSNEKFWEDLKPVVSNLRIRGTYGLVGNDAIGSPSDRFFYLSNVNMNSSDRSHAFGRERGNSKNGISITRYSNPDITWETGYKTNIALELGLLDKLQLTADYFNEHRKNILMVRSDIPTTMGLSADISANLGEAWGEGVDLSANFSHSFSQHLWMQSMANFTYATSKYKVYEEPLYDEHWLTRVGYPISVRRGYIAERLFVDDDEVANSPQQHFGEVRGGDIKYMDINGDGQITELDQVPMGYPQTPEINYGFGVSVGYKSFDISVFFQGLARESFWIDPQATAPFRRYTYSGESFPEEAILQNQVLKAYADSYWSEENRNVYALWPRLSPEGGNTNNEQNSTWFMRDGTFLRLKQLEMGYSLPKHLISKIHAQRLRVYLNGTNLLTWSKFKLWDVEMAGNGLGYPIQRVFNIGIQLSF
ncbi:TonB-dependent receptor [Parapedobacter composti]|uniref:TonB-dependent receptor n=1 Tax=Parapedobacter composti TaxID=623281 RepID=UPI001FCD9297|nr:TonB-dependent receptor [Parapedobacter composti]